MALTPQSPVRNFIRARRVVLTPNMTWHQHGNETSGPMIMFDALDIPIVNHFGASFKGLIDGPHELNRPAAIASLAMAQAYCR